MGLTLSDADLERLQTAQEALLSVFARPSVSDWCEDILIATGRLLRTDTILVVLPHSEGIELRSSPEIAPFLGPVRQMIEGVDIGANRYSDPQVQGSQALRRQRGLELWTNPMLVKLDGRPLEDTGWFYHEFIDPSGAAEGGGMTVQLTRGEAMLLGTPGHPKDNPFGEDWLRLAGLLLPAFKAAVRHVQHRRVARRRLLQIIDRLPRMTWIWDGETGEVHRNPPLRALLAEPDAHRVEDAARILVRETALLRAGHRKTQPSDPGSPGERTVGLDSGRYRLRAFYLGPHPTDKNDLIMVRVEPVTPKLPSRELLEDRCRLTRRQAEVALLLARGASNKTVADTLGISPHTVRSHAEVVFQKLDVHTRKALALHLMALPNGPGTD